MGQHKGKGGDRTLNKEPSMASFIQKLVTAVVDESKNKRLKVLAARVSKNDLLSVIEPHSRFNLLQIAVIMNNIPAVEFLFSLGADKKVLWDTLAGTEDGWDLSYLPERVFTDFQNYANNLGSPNVAQDAYEHSGLSLLHLAVLVGHKDMIRFLVDGEHLPVDVRATITETTPLMTAITRACIADPGTPGPPTHVCTIKKSHPEACEVNCSPMLPVARLLLELGADPGVVDSSGACLIATAAEAGNYGMWRDLMNRSSDMLEYCPTHAGHVMYGAASNCVRTGNLEFVREVLQYLRQQYAARDREKKLREELAAPIKRRKSTVVGGVLRVEPGSGFMQTHALCRLLVGKNVSRYHAMNLLLSEGVPVAALRLGREHYTVTGHADLNMLAIIVQTLTDVGRASLSKHADVLFGLLVDSLLQQRDPFDIEDYPLTHGLILESLSMLDPGPSCLLTNQSLLLHGFSPEVSARFDFCTLGRPVSPLVLAAAGAPSGALENLLKALQSHYDRGQPGGSVTTFINRPDPCGRLPLIEAIVRNRVAEASSLLEFGADLGRADGMGRGALHELARLGEAGVEMSKACLRALKQMDPSRRSEVLQCAAVGSDAGRTGFTIAEIIACCRTWYLLPPLVKLGMHVHPSPDKDRVGFVLYGAVQHDASLAPSVLCGPSLADALKYRCGGNATALAVCITCERLDWIKPLLDACRELHVDPDELLDLDGTENGTVKTGPTLFAAISGGDRAVPELLKAGYNIRRWEGHCLEMKVPLNRADSDPRSAPVPSIEKITVLMWAAAVCRPATLQALLDAGLDARFSPSPESVCCTSATTLAIDFPTLANNTLENFTFTTDAQLECVLILLRAKASITEAQLATLLRMIYKAQTSKAAQQLWSFLHRKAAVCAECGMIGAWHTCAQCRAVFYCGRSCQDRHWAEHKSSCEPVISEAHPDTCKAAAEDARQQCVLQDVSNVKA